MDIQEKELPLQVPLQVPLKEADQEENVTPDVVKTARLTDQGDTKDGIEDIIKTIYNINECVE
jgi:hypothetical protein